MQLRRARGPSETPSDCTAIVASCKLVEFASAHSLLAVVIVAGHATMTTSVQFTQHALALSSLSPEAAEECRRSVSRSASRSDSSSEVVRFHYEVGVVEPHSGALHLIQVCCQVCVEGRGCCKASACCDAVCCQLQLPMGPQGPKRLTDEEEEDGGVASRTIELPRTVAASASSHAGLASYPITARELMVHVAKCCDLCLESKGAACCKKDCCAVSCCLVSVEVMDRPTLTNAYNKLTPVKSCGTKKKGACCPVTVIEPASTPLEVKKPCGGRACCTKDQKAKSPCVSVLSPSHNHEVRCADNASPVSSLNEHWPHVAKGCTGKPEIETPPSPGQAGCSKDTGGSKVSHEHTLALQLGVAACGAASKCCTGKADVKAEKLPASPDELSQPSSASARKPCSSAAKCCDSTVDERAPLLVSTPCNPASKKGCCETSPAAANKTCGSKKDTCAGAEKSRNVQPVDVRSVRHA